MKLFSDSIKEGELIIRRFTCDGIDVSPELHWQNAPEKTASFALICEDPDAPVGTWTHWIIFNIPADSTRLPEALPKTRSVLGGVKQGTNDFGDLGYGGPCPPGRSVHHYHFKLYALDSMLDQKSGIDRNQLLTAIKGRVLEMTELVGKYHR